MAKKRILSGMRPTGKLHLGHLYGALNNWVKLQDDYDCYYMVADFHALTTDYANTSKIPENTREMVLDWLTVGLEPNRSVIFKQSDVIEHAELNLLMGMITPLGWLFRCPTYKEQLKELGDKDLHTFGFLGYPVLQAADITLYKANAVPVGEDQLPHLELTREIVRRFNNFYGNIFPEPQALLAPAARLPGVDGRKMSKSYGNAIVIDEEPKEVEKKVQRMFTDPKKIRATDIGHPEGCVVAAFLKLYLKDFDVREQQCRKGEIGCVACKKELSKAINEALAPLRERRAALVQKKDLVREVLDEGKKRALAVAQKTMEEVRKAVNLA